MFIAVTDANTGHKIRINFDFVQSFQEDKSVHNGKIVTVIIFPGPVQGLEVVESAKMIQDYLFTFGKCAN